MTGRFTTARNLDAPTDLPCCWPGCSMYITERFRLQGMRLCQEHCLKVWASVQRQMEDGVEITPAVKHSAPVAYTGLGWVYYIKVGDRIKIGHSTDIERRLRSYPPTIEILGIVAGGRSEERDAHRRARQYLSDGREWFRADAALIEEIRTWLSWSWLQHYPIEDLRIKRRETVDDLTASRITL